MFTVRLAAGVCMDYSQVTAQAATIHGAVDFASEFAPNECGVIVSTWIERNGRLVLEVYDWCECCCPGPPPILAEVIAPPGFTPPAPASAGLPRPDTRGAVAIAFGHWPATLH
jgi:hypothetical protein